MSLSPEDKPYACAVVGPDDHSWKSRVWSAEEWDQIPPERRPPWAMRAGSGRAEIMYGGRTDAGAPVDAFRVTSGRESIGGGPPAGRGHRVPVDSIIVDPSVPIIRDYICKATLDGLIRTTPASDGKVYIIPLGHRLGCGGGRINRQ